MFASFSAETYVSYTNSIEVYEYSSNKFILLNETVQFQKVRVHLGNKQNLNANCHILLLLLDSAIVINVSRVSY